VVDVEMSRSESILAVFDMYISVSRRGSNAVIDYQMPTSTISGHYGE